MVGLQAAAHPLVRQAVATRREAVATLLRFLAYSACVVCLLSFRVFVSRISACFRCVRSSLRVIAGIQAGLEARPQGTCYCQGSWALTKGLRDQGVQEIIRESSFWGVTLCWHISLEP